MAPSTVDVKSSFQPVLARPMRHQAVRLGAPFEEGLGGRWNRVPVMRAQLPAAERLLPYLQRIDASRTYSNFGPLVGEFHQRLAACLGVATGAVISANSGTSALVGAILATAGRAQPGRPLALIPAYTFVATAAAVEQCGYQPMLVDIDAGSWMLDPRQVADMARLDEVGLVVPVAPYGIPVPQAPWQAFSRGTGIPVVIDGAASFDCLQSSPVEAIGRIPVAISFHATKSFGAGEGGAVVCTDKASTARVGRALNFGFWNSRDSGCASINGKLSEYHAAVGLAELDDWDDKRARFARVASSYRKHFDAVGVGDRLVATPDVSACYALLHCHSRAEAGRVSAVLLDCSIDSRYWYGGGIHRHHYYRNVPRTPLPATARVASRLLGLPCAVDLDDAEIARVAMAVAMAVTKREPAWWG